MAAPIPLLTRNELRFPDPETALTKPNGLLAVGGSLSPDWLLKAYSLGIFPWFDDGDTLPLWWSPDPRAVLPPTEFHISRSLAKRRRRNEFRITFDQNFNAVICACADKRRDSTDTWITDPMKYAYQQLHRLGYAHSVEAWQDDLLVGGLYGVSLGHMFFGESMFSRVTDASKVAFAALAEQLESWQFSLIDCQIMNRHLASLGAREIPRKEFLQQLSANKAFPDRIGYWQFGT